MNTPPTLIQRPPPPVATLALFDGEHATHRLSRSTVDVEGLRYRVLLAVPREAPPATGFPILYLLDGNAAFDLMSAEDLASAAGVILAGIAHDSELRFERPSRSRDYTPALDGQGPHSDPTAPGGIAGGAEPFLERLAGPLREHVEGGLAIDARRRMIFGHSLAGMFTLYALLRRPEAFSGAIAASPSIWWGDQLMLTLEEQAPGSPHPQDVLIALGDSERRSSANGPHWDGPAPHTLEMIRRLQQRSNMNVASRIFEGLGHAATLPATLPLALEFAASRR